MVKEHVLLTKMDQLLQCAICAEHFRTPVLLPCCGQAFCSLCVRRSLCFKKECPSCRKTLESSVHLHPIRLLEEISNSFKDFREAQRKKERKMEKDTLRKKRLLEQMNVIESAKKKRKLNDNKNNTKRKKQTIGSLFQSASQKTVKQVQCPVCFIDVNLNKINLHMDRCLATQNGRNNVHEMTKQFHSTHNQKRMTCLHYSSMSLKDLKILCADNGLPTTGSKEDLIRLHRELRIRNNAECDSIKPKSKVEVTRGLMKDQNKGKQHAFFALFKNKGSNNNKFVNFDDNFKKLQKEQKKKRKEKKNKKKKKIKADKNTNTIVKNENRKIDEEKSKEKLEKKETVSKKIEKKEEMVEKIIIKKEKIEKKEEMVEKIIIKKEKIENFEKKNHPTTTSPPPKEILKVISPQQQYHQIEYSESETLNLPSHFRAVWSTKLETIFYFNTKTKMGQLTPPASAEVT